ncbi:MAG: hypothetical protein NT166_02625 [Candidatus Aminicenantes bacterium]|nr:hypothetical protein [Candidatus Aminicenantes bacterium]
MNQFTISVKNDFRPEIGINIAVKGLGDKTILQPQETRPFEQKQDAKALVFTLTPSSGGTESPRKFNVEVTNGTEKTTTEPRYWEVEITASASPVNVNVVAGCDMW